MILVTIVTTGGGILFEVGVSFSMENAKFRPVLANFDYLVASLRKMDKYQVWIYEGC